MRWRDVPMPPAVAALPRDKRGFPVPWISEWSSGNTCVETLSAPHLGIAMFPMAGCTCTIGVGEPDLGTLCQRRQIVGMVERLCDVCGEFIPPGPIYFLGGDVGIDVEGNRIAVPITKTGFRECGLHYECALYSAQVCPGITTAGSDVKIVECLAYYPQPELIYFDGGKEPVKRMFNGFHDPDLLALAERTRVALNAVFANPLDATSIPVTEWVDMQQRRTA